jgi:5-methylcytosine-specific restriction endonuclease McrA
MSNSFGIPQEIELKIRKRDKKCVYCNKKMLCPYTSKKHNDSATIEHLRHKKPFYWKEGLQEINIAICCGECNSSRGAKPLKDWFKIKYCTDKNINENTVAAPVKGYLTHKTITRGKK